MKTFISTLKSLRWANQCNILEKKRQEKEGKKKYSSCKRMLPSADEGGNGITEGAIFFFIRPHMKVCDNI